MANQRGGFDIQLAVDCAESFAAAFGLGCTISDTAGALLHEVGYGCASCEVCAAVGQPSEQCINAHNYGQAEAERFGGKYEYFCPMGLSFITAPIVGQAGSAARLTLGPFLMVDRDDYVAYDLQERCRLAAEAIGRVYVLLDKLPYVAPGRVHSIGNILFFAVGFLNNVSAANRMMEQRSLDMLQGQITSYIMELKKHDAPTPYPLESERAMVAAIAGGDRAKAQELLNELLGFALFSSGGDLARIKTRIYELLVVISRAAIDNGAATEQTLGRNHDFITRAAAVTHAEDLYELINDVLAQYMDSMFGFADVKHKDVIRKSVEYINSHYADKLTLEQVAGSVYLSPSYFSKIFKQETGKNFNSYLNEVRINKSKGLLRSDLKLIEVATLVGYEDQSYFTKVFKRVEGVSPNRYRQQGG